MISALLKFPQNELSKNQAPSAKQKDLQIKRAYQVA